MMSTPRSTGAKEIEAEVSLKGKDGENVSTVRRLVSAMIEDASHIYGKLYQVKEGATVTVIFKLAVSRDKSKGEEVRTKMEDGVIGEEVRTEKEGVITVLCKHEHPFLNTDVWMQTKRVMDSTFLKGKIFSLVVLLPQDVSSQLNACPCSILQ